MVTVQRDDEESAMQPSGDYVQSLARGLAVIRAFSDEHPRQTISDVARRTNLSRPAARRFLRTLVTLGYVATDGSLFWLTPQVLELGSSYLSSLSLPDLAQPHLAELSAAVNESSSVAVLDGFDIVYVARVQVRRIMAATIVVGTRLTAANTAMGRVLLAGQPPDRRAELLAAVPLREFSSGTVASREELAAEVELVAEQGFCIIDHRVDFGLRSVAAPILDRNRNTIAAVSVSASSMTYPPELVSTELLPQVLATAQKITVDIGHTDIGLPQLPSSN